MYSTESILKSTEDEDPDFIKVNCKGSKHYTSISEAEVTRSHRKYLSHTHSDEITPIAPVTGNRYNHGNHFDS